MRRQVGQCTQVSDHVGQSTHVRCQVGHGTQVSVQVREANNVSARKGRLQIGVPDCPYASDNSDRC